MTINIRHSIFNRPSVKAEKLSRKSITETAGYIPLNVQIDNQIRAGEALDAYRRQKYDTYNPSFEMEPDPSRKPGFDPAQASQIANSLQDRYDRVMTKRKAAAEAKKKATMPTPSAPAQPEANGAVPKDEKG